ncbi:MAG: hypothetical protein QM758_21145 [Armatimonas sp.]
MKKNRRAFTMLEVVLSILFFTMMVLLVATTVPMAARSSRQSSDSVQASSLILHKIDQLQSVGYAKQNGLTLASLRVVDDAGTLPTTNDDGAGSGAADFTTTDHLSAYFVNAGANPRGTIHLAPYMPSQKGSGSGIYYTVVQATIIMTWKDSRDQSRSLAMRTLIPKTPLQ